MTTALHFLIEWAGEEKWKKFILGKAVSSIKSESTQLLNDVVDLMDGKRKAIGNVDLTLQQSDEIKLIIKDIKHPVNINALSKDVAFSLGDKLNVFYGENGSGKSSYVRVFRKLAENYITVEKNLSIIPNVYDLSDDTVDKTRQTVEVTYTLNGEQKSEHININNSHSDLRRINVFDSNSVIPLIGNNLSFTVLPKGFEYFQNVSDILDSLRSESAQIIERERSKQQSLFVDTSFDLIRKELEVIMNDVKDIQSLKSFLDSNYIRPESYEETVSELDSQIKELEFTNPVDKIKILSTQKSKLELIKQSIEKLATGSVKYFV